MVNILYVNSDRPPTLGMSIFAVPKPFEGHIGTIQRNAIASWTQLKPTPEILLFGDEEGTESVTREFGLRHIPQVDRNDCGTPMLDGIFAIARQQATYPMLAYLNADIILTDDFILAVSVVAAQFSQFLMLGRRWDADITASVDFSAHWDVNLRQLVRQSGTLATYQAKDYFVFPKSVFPTLPPFAIGRGYWDTWMVEAALDRGYPVVDASLVVSAIHQNHPYNHLRGGKNAAYFGREAQRNKALGNVREQGTIAHATWQLKPHSDRDAPQVSVVIDRTSSSSLRSTIESILNQTDVRCEILIVGDRLDSPNPSLFRSRSTPIRYINLEQPGAIAARNQALAVARGEFITFIESDGVFVPNTLAKQVARFEKEASTLDVLLSGCEYADGEETIEVAPWHQIPDLEDLHVWKLDRLWQPLSQSAVSFRRHHLAFAGGFDPRLDSESATIEMILRLVFLRGSRAAWLSEVSCRTSRKLTITPRAQQVKAVVDRLFERAEVKPWMHRLKSRADNHLC
ncbi:MAG: glycosyltransferase family 2 protein [Cyanobacteriota bacterium]|nr:glycosyltransferase family 2 protein [Cyanobacteriota bacterium]